MTARWSGPGRALQAHLSKWQQAQETQHLLERWPEGKGFREDQLTSHMRRWFLFAQTYSYVRKGGDDPTRVAAVNRHDAEGSTNQRPTPTKPDPGLWGEATGSFISREWEALNTGPTYYVSGAIMQEVVAIAEKAEAEPIFPTDLQTPAGFMVFERPLLVGDLHPVTGKFEPTILVPHRAVAWMTCDVTDPDTREKGPGLIMFWYTDTASWREVYPPSLAKVAPEEAKQCWVPPDIAYDGAIWPIEVAPWKFGRPWTVRDEPDEWMQGWATPSTDYQRRFWFSLCRLMWQSHLVVEPHRHTRPESRSLKRMNMPTDGYVRVLSLRRRDRPYRADDDQDDGDPRFGLMYRRRVRGHWRRVHLKSMGPARLPDGSMDPTTHRLTWIEDFWQGPETAPVRDGYDVYSVTR